AITVALALAVVGLVIAAGCYMDTAGNFRTDVRPLLAGMFQALTRRSRNQTGDLYHDMMPEWA
ncbi:MAG TPA: hypothetical protein VF772_16520, partial [Terriglobales bacterium]